MEIEILQLIEGAKRARGTCVIIDVFRAYSVECYALAGGISRIYPVASLDAAYSFKREHPEYLLCGEREGKKEADCDFGNSPFEINRATLNGKRLIHTTSAGTQGIECAVCADTILVAALCNAKATADFIRAQNPAHVSLVCMGLACMHPTTEDTACAEYIKSLLLNLPFDRERAIENMRRTDGQRFFVEADQSFAPREDFDLCTSFDKFDFALQVRRDENNRNYIEKPSI